MTNTTTVPDRVKPAVDLLDHLVNQDRAAREYILDWIALALCDHAKLPTAIAMHGPQGSGKSLFWNVCVLLIFGRAGYWINDSGQLADLFNDWVVGRNLIVVDNWSAEAAPRVARCLKRLIYEPEVRIQSKCLPPRTHTNATNVVVLSNDALVDGYHYTSRFFCVEAKRKLSPAQADRVHDWSATGGLDLFETWLRRRDVDRRSLRKPPQTQPRARALRRPAAATGASA